LHGCIDWDGHEYINSQHCLDALEVPMHARDGSVFRRLTKLMREHGWEPIRIKLNGVDGGGVTERVRGLSMPDQPSAVSTHLKTVSRQNRHEHPLRHWQGRFAP
jgi:hypothetical protein